jgi:hypothetical protein
VHFLVTRGTAVVCPYNYSTTQARADYDYIAASAPANYLPEGKICVFEQIPQTSSHAHRREQAVNGTASRTQEASR